MTVVTGFPQISHDEVFARLMAGAAEQPCLLTPNRRLALSLQREYGERRIAGGAALWDTPDILPLSGFIQRAADDARYVAGVDLPQVLAAEQSRTLWESLLRDSETGNSLLAGAEAAVLAHEAWQLTVSWRLRDRLRGAALNEDARAFLDWLPRYERELRRNGQIDAVELADHVLRLITGGGIRVPQQALVYGFDSFTPQQAEFLEGLRQTGCEVSLAGPADAAATVTRAPCADAEHELRAAAIWARVRLEAGCRNIGIVAPDIAARRAAIVRVFSATMAPDYALPEAAPGVLPFNLSLGEPLTSYALVNAALTLLQLAGRNIEFERASRLLRSPFIAGAESERTARAVLDIRLRQHAEPLITLDGLCAMLGGACPQLTRVLTRLSQFRKDRLFGAQAPSAWARAVLDALALAGFPGERPLDSFEYQTLKRWHDVVAAFAALDRVVPKMGYAEALSRLRRLAGDALFQPESPDVPIQILGVLETTGLTFDALWVMGLDDEHWPPAYRPNPFLPLALQRAAGLPQSSAVQALETAQRMTSRWSVAAPEVVLSHALHDEDRELQPSPLIVAMPERRPDAADFADFGAAIHAAHAIETVAADAGPAVVSAAVTRGGSALLRDQAACPFRAFASHRLQAQAPEAPHTGLDALERGTLVHRVLAEVWMKLRDSATLAATNADALDALLAAAADTAIAGIRRERQTVLAGRFAEIEKRRLIALARASLEQDRRRNPFAVIAVEDQRSLVIGPLTLNARLDRVDQSADGRRIIIDYKTGEAKAASMLGARPDEPQLPLYLVAAEPEAAAVAFAQVRTGDQGYVGLARDGDLLPGVKALAESRQRDHHAGWPELVAAWRSELERLATQFAGGHADVDPKRPPHTCQYCDLGPFCRIRERSGEIIEDAEGE
ncbi:MAG: PD-(D/E)XK nuclease family protein [Burkholderiales bacterium]